MLEHQRRIGEERAARVRNALDIGEHVCGRKAPETAREIERLSRGNRIAVHHLERIAALDDVNARERAPGAADRVESAAAARGELRHLVERLAHDAIGALERFVCEILSASPPSGSVTPLRTLFLRTSINSSEPPPRSPTMPSG